MEKTKVPLPAKRVVQARILYTSAELKCPNCDSSLDERWNEADGLYKYVDGEKQQVENVLVVCERCKSHVRFPKQVRS